MILGNVIGKSTTLEFKFLIIGNAKKFQYVQVLSQENYVLGQVIEIEKEKEAIAKCVVLGFRENGILKGLRVPFENGIEVLESHDDFIKEVLGLKEGISYAKIGNLDGHDNITVSLDINKLLTKHICVLAKSGSGKSYVVGVLLEELMEKNVPVVVIDPHGEYNNLRLPNDNGNDITNLEKFGMKPFGYLKKINEMSPDIESNHECKPIKLDSRNLTVHELIKMLPGKLSSMQMGTLYSSINYLNTEKINFNELLLALEMQESNSKWTLINIVEYIQKLNLFSDIPTEMNELVQPGKLTIINLKGIQQDIQDIVVYKILNDLFLARKKDQVLPFFLVIEEAHNYIPERNYGEAKSSGVIRQIFSEGRKFGLGACLVSQRPSRVDKSAISQCSTQIVLKTTNPNDVRAISNSVEGLTIETEKEIINLQIGTALVTGVVDTPLLVNIRPRKTRHGGVAVKILEDETEEMNGEDKQFMTGREILPLINQKITIEDFKIIYGVKKVVVKLVPCILVNCYKEQEFNLLINLNKGNIVTSLDYGDGIPLSTTSTTLTPKESKIFSLALSLKNFSAAEIFSKSGTNFSEIYDIINLLTKKGYINREANLYQVDNKFKFLSDLGEYRNYEKIQYAEIEHDEKLDKSFDSSNIKEILSRFVKVKEVKDCFLVTYN